MVVFQGFVVLALRHPRGPGTWHTTTQKRNFQNFWQMGVVEEFIAFLSFFDTEHYQYIRDEYAELSKRRTGPRVAWSDHGEHQHCHRSRAPI